MLYTKWFVDHVILITICMKKYGVVFEVYLCKPVRGKATGFPALAGFNYNHHDYWFAFFTHNSNPAKALSLPSFLLL